MIQSSIGSTRKEVVAENGVVAGGHNLVAQTGVKIMQQSGNAVDAGVAAAFVATGGAGHVWRWTLLP